MSRSVKQISQAESQLKEACRLTGAHWAIWVERSDIGWDDGPGFGLNQSRLKSLHAHMQDKKTTTWLAGSLSSNRPRWQSLNNLTTTLRAKRLYVYPTPARQKLLLVGAEPLDRTANGFFRFLAAYPPFELSPETILRQSHPEAPLWPFASNLEASYDPQQTLESILEQLASRIPSTAAYLAIRYGDSFHVQAVWECPSGVRGYDIPVEGNETLQKIIATGKGLVITGPTAAMSPSLPAGLETTVKFWLGVPVMIGRQVIGLAAFIFSQSQGYKPENLESASQYVNQLAYGIESAIIFSEATRYLQQLALLNELASTAALGVEADSTHPGDDFARRVMIRLRREFNTDWAAVLLLSADGRTLQESGGGSQNAPPWIIPVKGSLMGQAVESGLPIRVNDLRQVAHFYSLRENLRSELAVPLKYRGKVIGALVLVSEQTNAFSIQDEQLLVVIASQLAGLFENVRLNDETRERARNLADSVRQLQAVRDTSLDLAGDLDLNTLLKRVAQRARDLVSARGAELGLYNEAEQVVEIVVSETPWENVQGIKIPLMAGVAGQMAAFGEPLVVDDYDHWPGRLLPERSTPFHAVAGVPLKFKEQVIGTLTVLDDRLDKHFVPKDLQLLELLAPQAAISIRNARLYQELEKRIQAQLLAESRLIRSARLAAVGEMAAGVAHELNNPLTTVTGFVELTLNELPPDSPLRPDLELVLQEAHRARGVVSRLLDFSRPVEDQRAPADVNDLINQVLPLFLHLARTTGISLDPELSPDLPWISIDSNQIKQVLINLIHNAIQAMPHGGHIIIRSSRQMRLISDQSPQSLPDESSPTDDWICIQVTDTGEGIPADILERIFEPFFSTRQAGKGTGLGLSVSYGIIASHGGWIEVDSLPAHGSSFRIYLPIV
jgi:two-component system NtrC family sensor kinase